MRRIVAWWLLVTGFLACPCHVFILGLLLAPLFIGTALGSFLTQQALWLYVGATCYFIIALVVGDKLLSSLKRAQSGNLACQHEQRANEGKHCH